MECQRQTMQDDSHTTKGGQLEGVLHTWHATSWLAIGVKATAWHKDQCKEQKPLLGEHNKAWLVGKPRSKLHCL